MGCLEQFPLDFFYFFDRDLEGFEGFSDFCLIKFTCFGEVDGDTAIHVGISDAIEFFQGHTDLVVGIGSSGAGDGEGVA